MWRLFRIVLYSVAVGILIVVGLVTYTLVAERAAYNNVEITSLLLRDGRYDPGEHYKFSRACVYPDSSLPTEALLGGYKEIDAILPESHVHWTMILFDDSARTFRRLYALNPKVRFEGGIACSPRLYVRTKTVDGAIVANAHEK